jgi:hypothetical protein
MIDIAKTRAALEWAISMNRQTADALAIAPTEAAKFDAAADTILALSSALSHAHPAQNPPPRSANGLEPQGGPL